MSSNSAAILYKDSNVTRGVIIAYLQEERGGFDPFKYRLTWICKHYRLITITTNMNQKDIKKFETLQKGVISFNATSDYRVALVFIDTKKQTLEACGDHGIRDFVTKNANQILALPTPHLERDFQLEQPIRPLNEMNITNIRNFATKMLKTINGGKKIYRYTPTNQPAWWDNSISLWTDGMQKNGKSLSKQQYSHHIRKCYSHYNVVIESDENNVDVEDNMVHTDNAVQEPLVQAIDSNVPFDEIVPVDTSTPCSGETEIDNAIQEAHGLSPSNTNIEVGEKTMSPIIVSRRPQRSHVLSQLAPFSPDNSSDSHVLSQLAPVAPENSSDGLHATGIDMPEIHDCVKAVYNVVHFSKF